MNGYYCPSCSALREVQRTIPENVFLTASQVTKFQKHTQGNSASPRNGVWTDPSTLSYRDLVVTLAASGWLEVDPHRPSSMILTVRPAPGLVYKYGQYHASANAIRLVLPCDTHHLHAFPEFAPGLEEQTCAGCGVRLDVIVCGSQAEGDWRTFTSSG